MLPRANRLTRLEIAEVTKRGYRSGNRVLGLRYLPALVPSRFAIVVPARELKGAVARHLLKRRLRALSRALAPQLSGSYQVVIFAGAAAYRLTFPELRTQLTDLFKQIR